MLPTIATGLVDPRASSEMVVVSALLGAVAWNFFTWWLGMPSSSSYALIGGLIGASWVHGGEGVILWEGLLYKVILPMVLSPLIGFFLALLVMKGLILLLRFPKVKKHASIFSHLQIASASIVALSHGLNDAQKSMGVITLGLFTAGIVATAHIPLRVIARMRNHNGDWDSLWRISDHPYRGSLGSLNSSLFKDLQRK